MRNLRSQEEIMATWQGAPDTPVVSICCITYNHELYIEDALEGFLIQETDFPFEILIHDDASTDRTADIIIEYSNRYPKIFKLILQKENQFSKNIRPTPIAIANARGKYIAFCEGDDYWNNSRKIQKQVNLLEQDLSASLCFHKVDKLIMKNNSISEFPEVEVAICRAEDIIRDNIIPTCSVLARKTTVQETPEWFNKIIMNDWPRWVMACQNGYALMINKKMGVYRVHREGMWSVTSWEDKVLGNLDFLYSIMEHGSNELKKAAEIRKNEIIYSIAAGASIKKRLSNHSVFGPLLRFWRIYINKSFPEFKKNHKYIS